MVLLVTVLATAVGFVVCPFPLFVEEVDSRKRGVASNTFLDRAVAIPRGRNLGTGALAAAHAIIDMYVAFALQVTEEVVQVRHG